jgi:hypothetical protein
MTGAVVTRGVRELSLRFEAFPQLAHDKIQERITQLTAALEARIEEAAPVLTGLLRSEVTERIYGDSKSRIAGYVQIYAPQNPKEYAKAATLEYGTDKPRRIPDHGGVFHRLGKGQKAIESRLTKPVHIQAFRYLRGPFEDMQPEIRASLEEALAEVEAESAV